MDHAQIEKIVTDLDAFIKSATEQYPGRQEYHLAHKHLASARFYFSEMLKPRLTNKPKTKLAGVIQREGM